MIDAHIGFMCAHESPLGTPLLPSMNNPTNGFQTAPNPVAHFDECTYPELTQLVGDDKCWKYGQDVLQLGQQGLVAGE